MRVRAELEERRVGGADEEGRQLRAVNEVEPVLDEVHHHGAAKREVDRRAARLQLPIDLPPGLVKDQRGVLRQEPRLRLAAGGRWGSRGRWLHLRTNSNRPVGGIDGGGSSRGCVGRVSPPLAVLEDSMWVGEAADVWVAK
eukprot:scaffold103235_cov63-Phaeocystis_antarctica.AAC.8